MNDNAPFFRERFYSARVPENTESGTVIITVTADDKDEGHVLIKTPLVRLYVNEGAHLWCLI